MSKALHEAILDALEDPRYAERGILVTALLDATLPLDADESLLSRSVYTIFRALPDRLLSGTTLCVATVDLPEGGVELAWEAKERSPSGAPERGDDLRALLGRGPHGDLVEIALLALERFCLVRAGCVDTYRERVGSASSFERPSHVIRRVVAVIPTGRAAPAPRAPRRQDPAPATRST
jgi:hypothetical protein